MALYILLWAAFAPTTFAADWRDYSLGRISTLQYDAQSYRREPGSPYATIEARDLLARPGRLDDGREYASTEVLTTIDCDRREFKALETRHVAADRQVLRREVAAADLRLRGFVKPSAGNLERFVISVCQLELRGLGDASTPRRWIHYLENERYALYFDSAGIEVLGPYEKVHVRLYYLGGAQMPNGEKIDLSEADWLIDCRNKRGAVATERKIRVEDGQGKVVASMSVKADAQNLSFALPTPGALPALFTESLCSGEL
ncbi:hypothetical protein [Azotobacter armeniacus]